MGNFAAPPLMQVPLASFLGLYTEAAPQDLPDGVSPLNWDCDFIVGSVKMRPGIANALSFSGNSTGPAGCTNGADVSKPGVGWANPGNITAPDSNFATVTVGTLSTAGPNTAGTGGNAGSGTVWTNPAGVTGTVSYATCTLFSNTNSRQLQATNFGFAVPNTFVPAGIVITMNANGTSAFPILFVQLLKNGIPVGAIKQIQINSVFQNITLGASGDLWGASWLFSDFNSATWGVQISCNTQGFAGTASFNIKNVQALLYSSMSATSDYLQATQFGFAVPAEQINGIVMGVTGFVTGSVTITAQLIAGGAFIGLPKTLTLGGSNVRVPIGNAMDVWNSVITNATINETSFGLALWVSGAGTVSIDFVDCTVYQAANQNNFNWVKTFSQTSGQLHTLALDSQGTLWQEDVINNPGVLTSFYSAIQPGTFAKSITLDDVEYIAISDLQNGADMPRQWNGINLDRISQVGPGAAPNVAFNSNAIALTSITQAPSFTLPTAQNGTWVGWSAGPNSTTPGNVMTFNFPSSFTLPSGFINGAYVAIQNFPTMNGFNPNSGATNGSVTNPLAYQIFNAGGPIQGQSAYTGFCIQLLQSGYFAARVSGGSATLQLSLATATATAQVPNIQVGSQFIIGGATPGGWNGTWTALYTPNAGQFQITNSSLTGNVATISFTLVTGVNPVAGQTIILTGMVNGNGIFNGTFVLISVGVGTATFALNAPNVASAAETGSGIVNGSIFQFDPQKIVGNASVPGSIQTTGNIGAGSRAVVVIFQTRTGYLTAPSPYLQFSTTGGASQLVVTGIPTGPPNVVARIVAFTGAQVTQVPGQVGNFFYIPEPVTVFDPVAGQDVTYTSTVIQDNVSTQATFTFTDAVLLAATAIDVQGNNLFAQKELGECLGVIPYAGRLFAWGELNKINNFINLSFDGGIGINSAFSGVGGGGSVTYPLGWTQLDGNGKVQVDALFGNSYLITNPGGANPCGMITQPAAVDQYGVNILSPNILYSIRANCRCPSLSTQGALTVDLYSPSFNRVYGAANVQCAAMSSTFQTFVVPMLTTAFTAQLPADLVLRLYESGTTLAGVQIEVDRIAVFPTVQPYLSTQLVGSYVNNFEAFDQITGNLDTSIQNQQAVRACFTLYDTLYMVKTGTLVSTQDNGITEPFQWKIRTISDAIGTPSVNGVDFVDNPQQGESYALIAGRSGVWVFTGGEPVLLTGAIKSLWAKINWKYGHTLWIRNDSINRRILVGVPMLPNQWCPWLTNANPTTPNVILAMSYRELNHVSELVESKEVRTSFTGKLIAPEMSRKWSVWKIQAPYADFIRRPDGNQPLFLGNSTGTGQVYQLTEDRTDDNGVAINETYTTCGMPNPERAEMMQLGLGRYQYCMMKLMATGNGRLGLTLLPDQLFNCTYPAPQAPLTLPFAGGFDKDFSINAAGNRVFIQFSMNAIGQSFQLSDLVLYMTKHPSTPVRGV